MSGKDRKRPVEFDDFDDEFDELDLDAIDAETSVSLGNSATKTRAWQRLEQRAETKWLHAQLSDWDEWDEYFDTH